MSNINNNPDDLRVYLAAEIERAEHEHRFAAADLQAVRLALLGGLITSSQAVEHIQPIDDFRFLGRLPRDTWDDKRCAEADKHKESA